MFCRFLDVVVAVVVVVVVVVGVVGWLVSICRFLFLFSSAAAAAAAAAAAGVCWPVYDDTLIELMLHFSIRLRLGSRRWNSIEKDLTPDEGAGLQRNEMKRKKKKMKKKKKKMSGENYQKKQEKNEG